MTWRLRAWGIGVLIALAGMALSCATVPAEAPAPEMDGAQVYAVVTRVLSDGCTRRTTDEFLIAHTDFLLKACRGGVTHCVRKVCVRLAEEDEEEHPERSIIQ